MVKKRACVFISGSGTNLKSIIKNTRDYNFPIKICLVVSNNKNAGGIIFAKKYSIPYQIITNKKHKSIKHVTKILFPINNFKKFKSRAFISREK